MSVPERMIDVVREICEFGCEKCAMAQGSEQCEKNIESYIQRIKEAEDYAIVSDEKDSKDNRV